MDYFVGMNDGVFLIVVRFDLVRFVDLFYSLGSLVVRVLMICLDVVWVEIFLLVLNMGSVFVMLEGSFCVLSWLSSVFFLGFVVV